MSQNPTNPTQTQDYFHTKVDKKTAILLLKQKRISVFLEFGRWGTGNFLDLGVLNVFPPKSRFIFL